MKYRSILGHAALVLGVSTSATAQTLVDPRDEEFADKGNVVISAERLVGFWHVTENIEGVEESPSFDTLAFLGNPMGMVTIYNGPRIGWDVFATRGLSLGAAFSYATVSGEGDTDLDLLNLAARIGYAYMFKPTVGFWPRGGITYTSLSADTTDAAGTDATSTVSYVAFTLEAGLVVAPVENTAIILGPVLDVGLSGGSDDGPDRTATSFGMQASLALWF